MPARSDACDDVTPAMVEAGFKALLNSGLADEYLEADKESLIAIYRAMRSEYRLGPPTHA